MLFVSCLKLNCRLAMLGYKTLMVELAECTGRSDDSIKKGNVLLPGHVSNG